MHTPLKRCCQNKVIEMQGLAELGQALQVFIAASPFILILPDVLMPGSSREAVDTLAEKLTHMAGDKVVKKVTGSSALPDFADAVRAVNAITLNRLHDLAFIHSLRHRGNSQTEAKLWKQFEAIYNKDGAIRSGSGAGWDWNPFW